jgi:hypothetical protein
MPDDTPRVTYGGLTGPAPQGPLPPAASDNSSQESQRYAFAGLRGVAARSAILSLLVVGPETLQ